MAIPFAEVVHTYTTSTSTSSAGLSPAVGLVLGVIGIIALWRVFSKAGKPGWAAIIPFYNSWTQAKVGGKPGWWMFLLFIPIVNLVIAFLIAIGVAKNFGKSTAFGVIGLFFFSIIGYLILAFGKAQYVGNGSATNRQVAEPPYPNVPPTTPPASSVQPSTPTPEKEPAGDQDNTPPTTPAA